jgi:hypothetical protein
MLTRIMPLALLTTCLVGLGAAAAAADDQATAEHNVPAGSSIRLHLEAGTYTIEGTDSEKVVVTYRTRSAVALKEVRVQFREGSSGLGVSVRDTPHNDFSATIEIPRRCNLWVRLTAGDLTIEDIEGDKDIESRAGDVTIEVPHPEQYGRVDAALWAGDINATVFNVSKDGLFRSFEHSGPGKYRLHVHLLAGDLTLKPTS